VIHFTQVYQYDEFSEIFDIVGLDLEGKKLLCQVRTEPDAEVVLEFSEDDGSIIKDSTDSSLTTTVKLYKRSDEMTIPPLFDFGQSSVKYYLTMIMYTEDSDIEDVVTIIKGDLEIIHQFTRL
jgi:hypothetical protein